MLSEKYVLHIPLYKFEKEEVIPINIETVIDELFENLNENGFDGFYTQNVKSHWKKRTYDEILITVFTSPERKDILEDVFCRWFEKNNHILLQEAYAFERNDTLVIKNLN